MKKKVYINGMAAISPQHTFENDSFLDAPISYEDNCLLNIDPDYKKFINPVQIRRMSRVLKFSLTTAYKAIQEAGNPELDAIITGTGFGCIEDTEKFLLSMLNQNEQMLNPTTFMQSTHNSVSGLIALNIKCNAYNYTYVHRGFSIESSVFDAMIHIQEGKKNVLVGGYEEYSKNYYTVTQQLHFWKKNPVHSLHLLEDKSKGSIAGEGAAFFVLSSELNSNSFASIQDVGMLYKPKNINEVSRFIEAFLAKNDISTTDIDYYVSGLNGDFETDQCYYDISKQLFSTCSTLYFKHLSGEYYTAASFGLWVSANIIKTQKVPEVLYYKKNEKRTPKYILLHNHYRNINHGFYLLKHEQA